LNWVTSRASGQIRIDFARLTDALNVGDSISNSLLEYEASQSNPALRELALKLALSDQLGTPITEQLISLATALRAEYLVEFRKGGARKETRLLLPLVFLVLPVTVLFAVYPSAQFLQFGSI
jgi:tight adherence protein C